MALISRSMANIFKHLFFQQVKTPLGRWNINNFRQTSLKIRYANEDNCGTCGEYYKNTTKNSENNEYKQNEELEKQYIYMMGSESLPDNIHLKN
jgi:hypothetical protein